MAILLAEVGLLERTTIYATDIDTVSLRTATAAIYPADAMIRATCNYQASGGDRPFSGLVPRQIRPLHSQPRPTAAHRILLHNLATDSTFADFHLILCRNVFIYFEHSLQRRVELLFWESLVPFGHLVIGPRETLTPESAKQFALLDRRLGIYVKRHD